MWRADTERRVGKHPSHWCERNHLQGSAAENSRSFFSPGGGEEGLIPGDMQGYNGTRMKVKLKKSTAINTGSSGNHSHIHNR